MLKELIPDDNQRILVLMPHPDDMEILCAGTLIRLRALGYEIHVATMTAGDKGSAILSREEIATIRREEARQGAGVIGAASYQYLEFADLEITFEPTTRRRIAEVLRAIDPLMVFTTPPTDYMFDHEITSQLVRDACFNAGCRNYATEDNSPPTSRIPYLYYSDAVEGHDIFGTPSRVSCIVDISAQMEQKVAALACHQSQRAWLQKQHGMDNYIESMRSWCARRGAEIGTTYGEAFCQHLGHPHPQDNLLTQLLPH
ncbi:MAG: PIG-L family deacetylase [Abitibacteriaceae bacterium]|nr:PIG-L family deacetylase [Abditibacteriaceae bacterium]